MTKQPKKLPLEDLRWWRVDKALEHCRLHPLFAVEDLVDVVNQGQVRSKVEYLDRSVQPPKPIALLNSEFLPHKATIASYDNRIGLLAHAPEWQRQALVLYLWEPEIKNIWPDQATFSNYQRADARNARQIRS